MAKKTCWEIIDVNPNEYEREVELAEEVCNRITIYVSEVECGNTDGRLRDDFFDALHRLEDFGAHIHDYKEEQLFDEIVEISYRTINLLNYYNFDDKE